MPKTLEATLRELDANSILAGAQILSSGALRLWIGDRARGITAETLIGAPNSTGSIDWTIYAPAIRWLQETAVRLYPDTPYAHNNRQFVPEALRQVA
jgi:hypothetical protein